MPQTDCSQPKLLQPALTSQLSQAMHAVLSPCWAGRLPEAERDQIEVQLGTYMKNCNESIARLQASASAGGPAAAAHHLGVVCQPSTAPCACERMWARLDTT